MQIGDVMTMKLLLGFVNNNVQSRTSSLRFLRYKSKVQSSSKKYSNTLNLPKTKFPLTLKDGAAARREVKIQKTCGFDELYQWQSQLDDRTSFVLHDGPPYANGKPHVGHAINKVLKDITNRYKLLRGYRVHYVPGWDCHGMPIEQKALEELGTDHRSMEALAIRKKAHKFATKTIKTQMASFRRWGVMADWGGCYHTMDKSYEAQQLEVFYNLYEKGYIYQDFMPVYWSPSSRTALAEAELVYSEHVSDAIYVRFPIVNISEVCDAGLAGPTYAVIWTTTPWTLPANQAICYGHDIKYSVLGVKATGVKYLVASSFAEQFSQLIQAACQTISVIEGDALGRLQYQHPLSHEILPMLRGNHVTSSKGTGLVHTAPAHGHEDFKVGSHRQLNVLSLVDEDGLYGHEAGEHLAGLSVLGAGNKKVLDLLSEHIIQQAAYTHSYPYDWRTHEPVIIRASKQWFIDTAKLKDMALEALDTVSIFPKTSAQGMISQLGARTYWCISRQRAWGVPIPVFYEKQTGKVLLTRSFMNHLQSLVKEHGTDCWWQMETTQLLPPQIITQSSFSPDCEFERGNDVLDIWFDSGTSWNTVLSDSDGQADLYLEGLDQFGGWFQSSLLTSVAHQGKAPYRSLVVHGFAMDEQGHKMSKSLGNVVDPDQVINGNKEHMGYGADVLRWWAAWGGLDPKVFIGPNILELCNEQVFRVRKTLRYLLGNLSDFDPSQAIEHDSLLPQDKLMLHLLHKVSHQVTQLCDDFQYSKALMTLEKFMNIHVSSFIHLSKDRVYCSQVDDLRRRSAQTVQWLLLEGITKYLSPVLPHLTEEVHQHLPWQTYEDSVFKSGWFEPDPVWHQADLAVTFELVTQIKDSLYKVLDGEAASLFDVILCCQEDLFSHLKVLQEAMSSSLSPLAEAFQCSTVSILSRSPLVIPDEATVVEGTCSVIGQIDSTETSSQYCLLVLPAENFLCERCRRYTAHKSGELCERCTDVLTAGWH